MIECQTPLFNGENILAYCHHPAGHTGPHRTKWAGEIQEWADEYVQPEELLTATAHDACRKAGVRMFAIDTSKFTGLKMVSMRTFDGWADFNLSAFDPEYFEADEYAAFLEELKRRGVLRLGTRQKSEKVRNGLVALCVVFMVVSLVLVAWRF